MKSIKFFAVGFCAMVLCLLSGKNANANTSVGCNPDPSIRASELITAVQNAVNAGGAQFVDLSAGCVYTLTQVNSGTGVDLNGLPVITNSVALTITGNGASIVRDQAAPQFRFLDVMDNARLALIGLALSGGSAPDSPPITTTQVSGGDGGAIRNAGELWIIKSVLSKNKSGDSTCNVILYPLVCSDPNFNPATGNGGAIFNTGKVFMDGSTIEENKAGHSGGYLSVGRGGGLANTRYAQIMNSAFLTNKAGDCAGCVDLGGGDGGAIANSGILQVGNSSFIGNATQYNNFMIQTGGGAISSVFGGQTTVTDSAFLSNSGAIGSAVNVILSSFEATNVTFYNNTSIPTIFGGENITLTHVTISNLALAYLPPISQGGSRIINNSILNELCFDNVERFGNYNVVGPGCVVTPTLPGFNLYATDAKLDPAGAQNNGGNTNTIALMYNSPAINLVSLAACALPADQRGVTRPQGGACDAGAYESTTYPRAYLPNALRSWAAGW